MGDWTAVFNRVLKASYSDLEKKVDDNYYPGEIHQYQQYINSLKLIKNNFLISDDNINSQFYLQSHT